MTVYLDTQVVVWLYEGKLSKISAKARDTLDRASRRLVSGMVILELEYLHELGRIATKRSSQGPVAPKIIDFLGLEVCELPFHRIATAALSENWTRDPFDRLVAANAAANGNAALVTADREIRRNYPQAIW